MKRLILTTLIVAIGTFAYSQWTKSGNNYTTGQLAIGSSNSWAPITINSIAKGGSNEGIALALDGRDYPEVGYCFAANGFKFYKVSYNGSSVNWGHHDGRKFITKMSLTNLGFLGLNNTNPWAPITINTESGSSKNKGVAIAFDGTNYPEMGYRFRANGNNFYQVLYNGSAINWKHYEGGNYVSKMSLSNSGFLGLNNTNPWAPITINTVSESSKNKGVAIAFDGTNYPEMGYRFKANGSNYYQVLYNGSSINWKHYEDGNYVSKMSLSNSGALGIGTTSTGTHKLAVAGSIGARKVVVEPDAWSDFVFENDYDLQSLDEIESFVTENKHLPGIPSKAEVTEDGINLGEMDAKLLQKIEELTLYIIQMNKDMKKMKAKNEQLEKQVHILKNK